METPALTARGQARRGSTRQTHGKERQAWLTYHRL